MTEELRSLAGFPKVCGGQEPFRGTDLLYEDGDLSGDLAEVEGVQALGQAMALAVCDAFMDLQQTREEYEDVRRKYDLKGTERPRVDYRRMDPEALAQAAIWDACHELSPEENPWHVADLRGRTVVERFEHAIAAITPYLHVVHDLRFNGYDLEVDFEAVDYETHVLRIGELVPRVLDDAYMPRFKRCVPVRLRDLVAVEQLDVRLLRHLQANPERLRELPWDVLEHVVAELLDGQGWEVTLTRRSKDGGVDIFATLQHAFGSTLAVIDCKQCKRPLGVNMVRAVAGLRLQHGADYGVLATTARFTKPARDLEQGEFKDQVSLKDFEVLSSWVLGHKWQLVGGLYVPPPRVRRSP